MLPVWPNPGVVNTIAAILLQGGSMISWQQWLEHPERSWVRHALFQIHLWVGAGISAYIFLMSVSGSSIVYRNEWSRTFSIDWLPPFHSHLPPPLHFFSP